MFVKYLGPPLYHLDLKNVILWKIKLTDYDLRFVYAFYLLRFLIDYCIITAAVSNFRLRTDLTLLVGWQLNTALFRIPLALKNLKAKFENTFINASYVCLVLRK